MYIDRLAIIGGLMSTNDFRAEYEYTSQPGSTIVEFAKAPTSPKTVVEYIHNKILRCGPFQDALCPTDRGFSFVYDNRVQVIALAYSSQELGCLYGSGRYGCGKINLGTISLSGDVFIDTALVQDRLEFISIIYGTKYKFGWSSFSQYFRDRFQKWYTDKIPLIRPCMLFAAPTTCGNCPPVCGFCEHYNFLALTCKKDANLKNLEPKGTCHCAK